VKIKVPIRASKNNLLTAKSAKFSQRAQRKSWDYRGKQREGEDKKNGYYAERSNQIIKKIINFIV
jgi:hypothetical protein